MSPRGGHGRESATWTEASISWATWPPQEQDFLVLIVQPAAVPFYKATFVSILRTNRDPERLCLVCVHRRVWPSQQEKYLTKLASLQRETLYLSLSLIIEIMAPKELEFPQKSHVRRKEKLKPEASQRSISQDISHKPGNQSDHSAKQSKTEAMQGQ